MDICTADQNIGAGDQKRNRCDVVDRVKLQVALQGGGCGNRGSVDQQQQVADPRRPGFQERDQSFRVGTMLRSRVLSLSMLPSRFVPTELRISPMPNSPIAMALMPNPSIKLMEPKVKRAAPLWLSIPTVAISIPRMTIAMPLDGVTLVTVEAATSPRTISAKYSAGPKVKAYSGINGENRLR